MLVIFALPHVPTTSKIHHLHPENLAKAHNYIITCINESMNNNQSIVTNNE